MARILWHGISPYQRTGYGVQTRLFAPLLRDLGHTVVIAQMGPPHEADRFGQFDGIPVIGPGTKEYLLPEDDQIRAALGGHPDLTIVLKDPWVLPPEQYRRRNVLALCPVDCRPMSALDRKWFADSGARAAAISWDGHTVMTAAGLKPYLLPHGIDSSFWTPGDQLEARRLLGLPDDVFIAGLNAMNLGQPSRKAFYEQLAGFARFHAKHPRSLLLAHTNPDEPGGTALRPIADQLGIKHAVAFAKDMHQTELQMRSWYRSLDVLLNATYGEGFGIPVCEAIACGVPVIASDCSALSEKITAVSGWLVGGQPLWVPPHCAAWLAPSIQAIAGALGKAERTRRRVPAELGAEWDAGEIVARYWKPVIEELT